VEIVVAAITYARLHQGEEGCWQRSKFLEFERNQLVAPGLYLIFMADETAANLYCRQTPRLVLTSFLLHVPSW